MRHKYSVIKVYNEEVILIYASNLKDAKERASQVKDAYYLCTNRWVTHEWKNGKWVVLPLDSSLTGYELRLRNDLLVKKMGKELSNI